LEIVFCNIIEEVRLRSVYVNIHVGLVPVTNAWYEFALIFIGDTNYQWRFDCVIGARRVPSVRNPQVLGLVLVQLLHQPLAHVGTTSTSTSMRDDTGVATHTERLIEIPSKLGQC
jgi:hypothetical protein